MPNKLKKIWTLIHEEPSHQALASYQLFLAKPAWFYT
jgi:hypothetical protein